MPDVGLGIHLVRMCKLQKRPTIIITRSKFEVTTH